MTEEALDDTKYPQANNVLGILGLAVLSKKEVLAKRKRRRQAAVCNTER